MRRINSRAIDKHHPNTQHNSSDPLKYISIVEFQTEYAHFCPTDSYLNGIFFFFVYFSNFAQNSVNEEVLNAVKASQCPFIPYQIWKYRVNLEVNLMDSVQSRIGAMHAQHARLLEESLYMPILIIFLIFELFYEWHSILIFYFFHRNS